jgi:hypothetical protein
MLKSRCENVSNGGVYLTFGPDDLGEGPLPAKLSLKLSVPRTTQNSFMYESIDCDATVIRHLPCEEGRRLGLALRFVKPVVLDLEA